MILLIDSGNSRLKLALCQALPARPDGLAGAHRATFEIGDTVGARQWLDEHAGGLTQAWGVNVAGASQRAKIDTLVADHGASVHWFTAQARTGALRNAYADPRRLGADRWAAMLGVLARQDAGHRPFVLASFGTATTIDMVDADAVFRGGMILPGPALMRRSLSDGTANLPLAQAPSVLFPDHTQAAIATGVAAAQAGALMRQYLLACECFGAPPALYVSGGGWQDVHAETSRLLNTLARSADRPGTTPAGQAIEFLDHPVLDGLVYMAHHSHDEGTGS